MDKIIIGILIPFLGTIIGSLFVFFMSNKINNKLKKIMLGFSAGIMVAASVWSLLIPAIEQTFEMNMISWLPAALGLLIGFIFLLTTNFVNQKIENKNLNFKNVEKKSLLVLSITIHNIPEGMAVGVALAAAYYGNSLLTLSSAIALSIGIAVQNIPEGAIVSMPLKLAGQTKMKAFMSGVYSGVVEPIFAVIAFFITSLVSSILPFVLSFAAGCMLFVVVSEIIPESTEDGGINLATIGFAIGFIIMMILDISLG